MDDSVYGNITSRSLIHHASQEISKDNTPLPVLQPPSKKKSTKRRRSALTIHRPSEGLIVSPRTLIDNTNKEKLHRKSSVYFPKADEILQLEHERPRSRRSLHANTDLYDDVSVDENEVTEERSVIPDTADISAIAGCHKKQKLQLGKLDNRAYSKIKEIKKKHSQAVVNQSPLEEEYDGSFWNDEPSSSFQRHSRTPSTKTKESASGSKLDHSHRDSMSNINLNTKAVRGSPLSEKQKPFTEKRIPHLSSDSDATLHDLPSEMDGRRKSRMSAIPKTASNVLSVSHPLPSLGTTAASGKHSPSSHSPAKTLPNILSQALHQERPHFSPLSGQRAQSSKIAVVSKHGMLSDGSGDADESSDEEGETADNNQNNLQDIDKSGKILERAHHHKYMARSHASQSPSKLKSASHMSLDPHENLEEEEGIEDVDFSTSIRISKTTTASPVSQKTVLSGALSQHPEKSMVSGSKSHSIVDQTSLVCEDAELQQEPRLSSRKTLSSSEKSNQLPVGTSGKERQNVPSEDVSASVSHSSAKRSSLSLPYNITTNENIGTHSISHISNDSASDMEETEADKNEPVTVDTAQELEPSESVSSRQQTSTSGTSRRALKFSSTSSSSYKIVNPAGIDMYASPRIAEDASYQLPHRVKTTNNFAEEAVNVSRKTRHFRKMSEVGPVTSPTFTFSTESGSSDPVHRIMQSTAIHDDNVRMLEIIQESSSPYLEDTSSEVPHQDKIFGRRKISHIPKVYELLKPSLPSRSSASDSITENDEVLGNTYQIPHQKEISSKKSASVSRKSKDAVWLSEREQSTSPAPRTKSRVSCTARKSMRSSVSPVYNVAVEDVLLQQNTQLPGRRSRKSVGTSEKDGHSAQVSDQELPQSPASVRSRVSSTKKKMHLDDVPDYSESVRDSSHQVAQQTEISSRKSVGTSRKERHSSPSSDQELSPGQASPIRPRVSSTKKRMHSDDVPDHSSSVEDTSHQVNQQTAISGRKSVGTSRRERHSSPFSDQELSPGQASPIRPRVSSTKKRMHSDDVPDHSSSVEDTSHQVNQQTAISGRKSVGTSRRERHSAQLFDQELSPGPASPVRSRGSGTKKRIHSDVSDYSSSVEDTSHQVNQQTAISGRKSVGTSRRERHSAQLSDQELSPGPASPVKSTASGTKKRIHSDVSDYSSSVEDTTHQVNQQTAISGRKSVGTSRRERHSAQLSDQELSPGPASPVRSRGSGTKKRIHSDVSDYSSSVEDTSHQVNQQTAISGRKSVGTSRRERHSAQLSDQELSPGPASPVKSTASGTKKRIHSDVSDYSSSVEDTSHQVNQQTAISGRKSVGTSRRERHSAQLSDQELSPGPASPVKSTASGTKKRIHSDVSDYSSSVEDTTHQVNQQTAVAGRKSVGTSRREKHGGQLSDHEPSPGPASPVRSRGSGTKKRIHSDVSDHSASVEDTSHQVAQQTEISGKKSVGTSRKERHSIQLSEQENSSSLAQTVRHKVSHTARKSMHSASTAAAGRTQYRLSTQMFNQSQSESAPSPLRSRVSSSAKKTVHSDATLDYNAAVEDNLCQMPQWNEISGRKSRGTSKKDVDSAQLSDQEESAIQTSQTKPRTSRTARISMHSAIAHDHNTTAEDALSQVQQKTQVLSRKSVGISRKDGHGTHTSDQEQSISPTSPVRSRVSGTARKSMRSGRTFDRNEPEEDMLSQIISSTERHSAQISEQEWSGIPESSVRSRVSGSTRKRMHSAAAFEGDAITEPQISGESSEMPNQTEIHHRKAADTSSRPSHTTKTPQPRHSTEPSVRLRISDSNRRKMHSTAIPDHDTSMKTVGDRSMSPIRTEEIPVLGRSRRKLAPAVHIDFDEEAVERSSAESSIESDQSPERVHERDLPLPSVVQDHDQEDIQLEDRVPAARASRQKKKPTVPRISANETKRIFEHFAGMKISRGALNSIVESGDFFWPKTFEAVEAYARHANRRTIEVQDVELLLYRQRLADDRRSMNALIARYMPMELRRQVIPMATAGNVVIP